MIIPASIALMGRSMRRGLCALVGRMREILTVLRRKSAGMIAWIIGRQIAVSTTVERIVVNTFAGGTPSIKRAPGRDVAVGGLSNSRGRTLWIHFRGLAFHGERLRVVEKKSKRHASVLVAKIRQVGRR